MYHEEELSGRVLFTAALLMIGTMGVIGAFWIFVHN